jgi:putative peptidoglycan lipid II flippase
MNLEKESADGGRSSFLRRSALLNGLFIAEGMGNFLLDATLASVLGLGARSDILYAAWSLPMTIGRGMFQSLTNSFMGYYADENNPSGAYNYTLTLISLLGLGLTILFALGASWWYPITILGGSPESREIGTPLAAIFSLLIGLFALSETFRAIYYREGKKIVPSASRLAGILLSMILILSSGRFNDLKLTAWGLIAGAALELLISWLGLRWVANVRLRPTLPNLQQLRQVAGVVGLPLAGQALRILASVIERSLASLMGPGMLTAVAFSSRIILTLERFVFRGFLITVIETYTTGRQLHLKTYFRLVSLVGLLLGVILAVLAYPLVDIAFGRGRFTSQDVRLLSNMLQFYAPTIFLLALTRIPLGLAYARRQGRVVFIYFVLVSVILVGLEGLMIFLDFGVFLFGLAHAIALVVAFNWIYRLTVKPDLIKESSIPLFSWKEIGNLIILAIICLVGTTATAYVLNLLLPGGSLSSLFMVLITGAICLGLAFLAGWLMGMEESKWLLSYAKARKRQG